MTVKRDWDRSVSAPGPRRPQHRFAARKPAASRRRARQTPPDPAVQRQTAARRSAGSGSIKACLSAPTPDRPRIPAAPVPAPPPRERADSYLFAGPAFAFGGGQGRRRNGVGGTLRAHQGSGGKRVLRFCRNSAYEARRADRDRCTPAPLPSAAGRCPARRAPRSGPPSSPPARPAPAPNPARLACAAGIDGRAAPLSAARVSGVRARSARDGRPGARVRRARGPRPGAAPDRPNANLRSGAARRAARRHRPDSRPAEQARDQQEQPREGGGRIENLWRMRIISKTIGGKIHFIQSSCGDGCHD